MSQISMMYLSVYSVNVRLELPKPIRNPKKAVPCINKQKKKNKRKCKNLVDSHDRKILPISSKNIALEKEIHTEMYL